MNRTERRATAALALVYALRMFGLFLLLPVMSIYAARFADATPVLIGLALGGYGLTQAVFQLPFGMLSDRLGRKRVIAAGLLIFMLGSAVAALADSLLWVVVGRAIQGAGAISAAVLALAADLTRPQQRTKAMALIGISIGFAFLASFMLAPPLAGRLGLAGLFWLITALAGAALLVLLLLVPTPAPAPRSRAGGAPPGGILPLLKQPSLLRLNGGIFCLHLILTALFVALPTLLLQFDAAVQRHWQYYAPVLILSVVGMLPLLRRAATGRAAERRYRVAIGLLLLALVWQAAAGGRGLVYLLPGLWLFFVGFNALEAMLPSLVSQLAPAANKGTAMGVYNTLQFLGLFVGGAVAGVVSGHHGTAGVLWFCALVAGCWLLAELAAASRRLRRRELGIRN